MARSYYSRIKVRRIFLADGDALIVKTEDLLYIIAKCKEIFPEVERISVYGAPKDILHKTPEEQGWIWFTWGWKAARMRCCRR